jgi:hypothetical protein
MHYFPIFSGFQTSKNVHLVQQIFDLLQPEHKFGAIMVTKTTIHIHNFSEPEVITTQP